MSGKLKAAIIAILNKSTIYLKSFIMYKRYPKLTSFLIGLISGYLISDYISSFLKISLLVTRNALEFIGNFLTKLFYLIMPNSSAVLNSTFLSDIAAVEGVLIGISIPITLQVVSWIVNKYRDQELAKFFTEELLYKAQYFLLLSNIVIAIFLRFRDVKNSLILLGIFIWFVINIIVFYLFIKLVERYAIDIDKVFMNKLKNYVQDILEK